MDGGFRIPGIGGVGRYHDERGVEQPDRRNGPHMMALPFLTKHSPTPQAEGAANVTVTTLKVNGTKETRTGVLSLHGGKGRLTVEPGSPREQAYVLLYLDRSNTYGWCGQTESSI